MNNNTTTSPAQTRITASHYNYEEIWQWLERKGKAMFGARFALYAEDQQIIYALMAYFLKDDFAAQSIGVQLDKGILLSGPVGCGKTSLMHLMRLLVEEKHRHVVKPCRNIGFEFIKDGYEVIQRHSIRSFTGQVPRTYCFDDLGTEQNLKHYGNACNVMTEILLSRYDLYVSHGMMTHLTTNLSASEIQQGYGSRIRSRLREMFNLMAFDSGSRDKRR